MKNEVKNSLFNSILLSVCVFVGVGFITGAEIWFYFAKFKLNIIFGLIVFAVLCFLLVSFAQKKNSESEKLEKWRYFVSLFSELCIAAAMISGIFETSRLLFKSIWWLVDIVSIACLIYVFVRGIKTQKIYNYFVAIFIVFVIVALFLFNNENLKFYISFQGNNLSLKEATISVIFATIYIFMNIGAMRPMIEKFNHQNKKRNKIIFSTMLTLILIFLIVTLSLFLWINPNISQTSMPFLLLFDNYGVVVKFIFLLGLMMCLISTCVGCQEGVFTKLNAVSLDKNFNKTIVIISSLIVGQIPFWIFIKIIYPLVGIFNLVLFGIEIFYSK